MEDNPIAIEACQFNKELIALDYVIGVGINKQSILIYVDRPLKEEEKAAIMSIVKSKYMVLIKNIGKVQA